MPEKLVNESFGLLRIQVNRLKDSDGANRCKQEGRVGLSLHELVFDGLGCEANFEKTTTHCFDARFGREAFDNIDISGVTNLVDPRLSKRHIREDDANVDPTL
ncbi:MAG: hypothetical protein M3Y72_20685 [Acidobacteriota bacterium]|nr:hypothetical protein [Acidobacteriota bacterium]